jgi:hypothetical protein
MKKEHIRIGTNNFTNASELDKLLAFNLLYGNIYEFIYTPDFYPWMFVNGSWTGALGYLMNDNQMDWIWKQRKNLKNIFQNLARDHFYREKQDFLYRT